MALGCRFGQRLIKVCDNVISIFDPDRQTHDTGSCTCCLLLFCSQLAVGGRCRMNDQAARVAKVGHMAKDLKTIDQFDTSIIAALNRNGEQSTCTAWADLGNQLGIG